MQNFIKFNRIRGFLLILVLLSVASCLKRVEKQGFMFEMTNYDFLEEGVTTKSKALNIMGSASFVSEFDGETWFYYSQDVEKLLFFKPKIINRKVLALKFDRDEILQNLRNYDLEDQKNIDFARNFTKVKSKKVGFFKSLFDNIGQISPQ